MISDVDDLLKMVLDLWCSPRGNGKTYIILFVEVFEKIVHEQMHITNKIQRYHG